MKRDAIKVGRVAEDAGDDYVPGTPGSRISLVWPLTREVVSLSRDHDVERRLQRHVSVVNRRER